MEISINIVGDIPDEEFDEFKELQHHIEYTGITENYPELENIHCEVHEKQNEKIFPLSKTEVFNIIRELYENFQKESADTDNMIEALNAAYGFIDFCEAIVTLHAFGGEKFVSTEMWKKFNDEFHEQMHEVSTFIKDNDWN